MSPSHYLFFLYLIWQSGTIVRRAGLSSSPPPLRDPRRRPCTRRWSVPRCRFPARCAKLFSHPFSFFAKLFSQVLTILFCPPDCRSCRNWVRKARLSPSRPDLLKCCTCKWILIYMKIYFNFFQIKSLKALLNQLEVSIIPESLLAHIIVDNSDRCLK